MRRLLGSFLVVVSILGAHAYAHAQFRVDTGADFVDDNPGDGVCEGHHPNKMRGCSLRAAVMESNARAAQGGPALHVIFVEVPTVYLDLAHFEPGNPAPAVFGVAADRDAIGDLDITSEIQVWGLAEGKGKARIDALRHHRHFEVHRGASLTLRNVELVHGRAHDTPTRPDDVLWIYNLEDEHGGAVRTHHDSNLVLSGVDVVDCFAEHSGGAVYGVGRVEIESSTFLENTARRNGGALRQASGTLSVRWSGFAGSEAEYGGAVYLRGSVDPVTLFEVQFDDNDADESGGSVYADGVDLLAEEVGVRLGDAVNGGGFFVVSSDSVELTRVTFSENTADWAADLRAINVEDVVLEDVAARDAQGLWIASIAVSGCSHFGASSLTVADAQLGRAMSLDCPGTLRDALFEGNLAGGLAVGAGPVTIEASEFRGNRSGGGAGLRVYAGVVIDVLNTRFEDNAAVAGDGGGVHVGNGATVRLGNVSFETHAATGSGGAVHVFAGGRLEMWDSELRESHADATGGAISVAGTADLTDSIIDVATARNGGGLSVSGSATVGGLWLFEGGADEEGGGALVSGSLTVNGSQGRPSIFARNWAMDGGGGLTTAIGGSVVAQETLFVLNDGMGGSGGGANGNGSMTFTDVSFLLNRARFSGALRAVGGLDMQRVSVVGNTGLGGVGGIALFGGGPNVLRNVSVLGNTSHASMGIGGIAVVNTSVDARHVTVAGNTGSRAAWFGNTSSSIVVNSIVADNLGPDCEVTLTSGGGNIVGASCGLLGGGAVADLVGQAVLTPPQSQLGPWGPLPGRTFAVPSATSPAVGSADADLCLNDPDVVADQRGVVRGASCDVGAVEY